MSATNDGGPAFPTTKSLSHSNGDESRCETIGGMSVRDWFAAQAVVSILQDERYANCGNEPAVALEVARFAGLVADAMLAERAKKAEAS
jgi:hypothetical protein